MTLHNKESHHFYPFLPPLSINPFHLNLGL